MDDINTPANKKSQDGHIDIVMETEETTLTINNVTAEELTILNCSNEKGPVPHLRCCNLKNFFPTDLSGEKVFGIATSKMWDRPFGEPSPKDILPNEPFDITTDPLDTMSKDDSTPSSCHFAQILDEYFKITERGSSISTEIRGGIVGFLTVAYIVLLNPQVLHHSGIPDQYAASATCLASCIATLICGLLGNIPVGCAPGLGLTVYFCYGMVPVLADHTDTAYLDGLLLVFLSGLIVFVLTVSGLVTHIVGSLAESLKLATIVGMGLFLAFVGMVEVGLVRAATGPGEAILELGDMTSWVLWLALINCLLIATLKYFKLNGSLLLCVIIVSILYFTISGDWPTQFVQMPRFQNPLLVFNFQIIPHLPLGVAFESVISFVLILLLDIAGLSFAVATLCGLSDQLASFQKSAFIGCSIATMIAAALGMYSSNSTTVRVISNLMTLHYILYQNQVALQLSSASRRLLQWQLEQEQDYPLL